jgi:ribosomal protein S6
VKRYEGLFILNTSGKEDGAKEVIDKVTAELASAGCKIETTQKMDKKAFVRVADKRFSSGYYANFIFEAEPEVVTQLHHRFALNPDVFRLQLTLAGPVPTVVPVPVPAVA